jgi:uncharacterized protein YhfF
VTARLRAWNELRVPDSTTYRCRSSAFLDRLRDRLVAAILRGDKTATSTLLVEYEYEGSAPVRVGERSMVVDSRGQPVAVIETTEVRVTTVGDVDLEFARDEGEGFASVADWRAEHERSG